MIKNITNNPITVMWASKIRVISPGEIVDINKEYECLIEDRFLSKYIGRLAKYEPPIMIPQPEIKPPPEPEEEHKGRGRPRKR